MARQRIFLDWQHPLSGGVVEYLLALDEGPVVDLGAVLVVVPTRHAGRRLRLALAVQCEASGRALLSPKVVEPAQLFERPPNAATELLCQAVWARVLAAMNPDEFPALFPEGVPTTDFRWALRTVPMFRRLQLTLAAGGLTIDSVLTEHRDELEEVERWEELARLAARVNDRLGALGWRDPNAVKIQQARTGGLPEEIERVVVAGVPDPTNLLPLALERLAADLPVDVLVHAPATLAEHFDAWGRPLADYWTRCPIPVEEVEACTTAQEQSRRVLELLAAADEGPGNVALGVADEEVAALLKMDLHDRGIEAREPAGRRLREHPLFTLLEELRTLLRERSAHAFADLLRHPDILDWLRSACQLSGGRLLRELDQLRADCLPGDLAALRFFSETRSEAVHTAVTAVQELLNAWGSQPFAAATLEVLATVYAERLLDPNRPGDRDFAEAARQLERALTDFEAAGLDRLELTADVQFDLLLGGLHDGRYYPDQHEARLDIEGWLELPWNDAPLLLVAGVNEGLIPGGRLRDAFLPDTLRRRLGLRHDRQLLARDSFLMTAMIESRREQGRAVFLCGRTGGTGDPLKPSRLVFRCPDEQLAARAARLLGPLPDSAPNPPPAYSFTLDALAPLGKPLVDAVETLHVTAFRDYLACPFRFYLRRVLGMETIDESATQIDAMRFGSLLHLALETLGRDPAMRDCEDDKDLREYLYSCLARLVNQRFGKSLPLTVELQMASAKERLRAAARVESALRREGWRTQEVELQVDLEIAGMPIRGRIDRLDYNDRLDRWRVLDYKSGSKAKDARREHLVGSEDPRWDFVNTADGHRWKDLQLPLYALMLKQRGGGHCEVGYFNLPKAVSETGLSLWDDLDAGRLAEARDCAIGIAERIGLGFFWPPGKVNAQWDDFNEMLLGDPHGSVNALPEAT